jgi:hypothetical protein
MEKHGRSGVRRKRLSEAKFVFDGAEVVTGGWQMDIPMEPSADLEFRLPGIANLTRYRCGLGAWFGRRPQMVSIDHFRQELLAQMGRASHGGLIDVLINSDELYRSLGGYPGSKHGMPFCCDAMQAEMKSGDILILDRSSGAGMTVRYLLPRAN